MSAAAYEHRPVMCDEVVELLAPVPPGVVVDATLGGGGHAEAVLDAHPHLTLLGLDRDPEAIEASGRRLGRFGRRARLERARFDRMAEVVAATGSGPVTAVLFDLGVSSPQLDRPSRGFSHRRPGPLDMRMDPSTPVTAGDLVNGADESALARLLFDLGDEVHSRRIARAVVAARPISDTTRLAEVVAGAVPGASRRRRGHPARRTFMALRLAVNGELDILPPALDQALDLLAAGGRLVALAYHSGEDRIVKDRLRRAVTGGCTCPPELPCACGARPEARLLGRKARRPTDEEVLANPRAASARLRAAERLAGS